MIANCWEAHAFKVKVMEDCLFTLLSAKWFLETHRLRLEKSVANQDLESRNTHCFFSASYGQLSITFKGHIPWTWTWTSKELGLNHSNSIHWSLILMVSYKTNSIKWILFYSFFYFHKVRTMIHMSKTVLSITHGKCNRDGLVVGLLDKWKSALSWLANMLHSTEKAGSQGESSSRRKDCMSSTCILVY